MTGNVWLAPLVVLGLGLVGGLWAAVSMRRRGRGQEDRREAARDADLTLEIADLEARRDDLYRRLRQAEADGVDGHDRDALELAAARALRELDLANRRRPAAPAGVASEASAPRGRSGLAGFAYGFVAASLIGLLVYLAVRDAKPGPTPPPAAGGDQPAAHPQSALPPMVAARVQALETRLAESPSDLSARRELAVTLLSAEQYVPAYQQATEILAAVPDDPDGNFVQGVVRLAMGQAADAAIQLDRVLAQHPEHVYAWLYKGLARYQTGAREEAIAAWEEGLRNAGGSHPDLEMLLAQARDAPMPPMAGGSPAGAAPGGTPPGGTPPGGAIAEPTPPTGGAALAWEKPPTWEAEAPTSSMRYAQYRVPGLGGYGECVVFYFGTGQGGDAMANAARWANQFQQADGRPAEQAMTTSRLEVGDIPVTMVEVKGTYTGGMGSGPPLAGAMLLGAIAEGPDANWFFKLTGPEATVTSQRAAFETMIQSLTRETTGG